MPQPRQLDLFRTIGSPPAEQPARQPARPKPPTGESPALTLAPPAKQVAPQPSNTPSSREELVSRLRAFLPISSIVLTNNRTSIISAQHHRDGFDLRIHRCFANAPDNILAAVATFLQSPKRSSIRRDALTEIRHFFQQHRPQTSPPQTRRSRVLQPIGATLDLRALRDEINHRYFDNQLSVHITWGRAITRRRRHRSCGFSVRLGTYTENDQLVRIHRCLDSGKVPRYVVEAVVYHEMLHAAVPPVVKNGRRQVHTSEFRRRERLFRHHLKAERWIDRNLGRLIGAR